MSCSIGASSLEQANRRWPADPIWVFLMQSADGCADRRRIHHFLLAASPSSFMRSRTNPS